MARSECVASADGQKDCFPLKGQCQIFLHNFFFASVCPIEAIIILIMTAIAQAVSDRKALFAFVAEQFNFEICKKEKVELCQWYCHNSDLN